MPLTVGVPRETFPGERRVAIVPRACEVLKKAGLNIVVEHLAGVEAGYPDEQFVGRGADIAARQDVFARADFIAQVRSLGANPEHGRQDLNLLRPGQAVIGMAEPLTALQESADLARTGVTAFALELIPRITRAQSMDVLSSMATVAGYESVLLAATALPKMFPMFMTAAGTVTPAKVFVLGAGVAGLQAIATARRLGAVVSAYDVRPVVKEQVESVGAKFVMLEVENTTAEGAGGYAKAMDESFYRRQAELLGAVCREQDVVISTAAVPGRKAPILITRAMVEGMMPGSVIIDLAAERGGNCDITRPGERYMHNGVTVWGPLNMPSLAPFHASQMYSSNLTSFLKLLVKDGQLSINTEDEIIRETLVTRNGEVVHARIRELLGIPQTQGAIQ
ncbi:Re/Si-specific NAD(P)(+) transhydrogenase subunit alpha [Nevskia soli]|uniref:Re/Si-specific NAD(P)(+) transhydrogenase subunit alpha n=1 Tax=Nevskia soli TaxID=418856 RepID=UPI0015D7356F|nr:Re/Si-specific NAD(P)(+) transhydrogenase subunit alpha [Nevskia soli]